MGQQYTLIVFNVSKDFTKEFVIETLNENVKGVTEVKQFGKDKNHYKIYFDTIKNQTTALIAKKVKIGYYNYKLNLPNPKSIQCLKCGKLGHRAKRCRSKNKRCLKCLGEHETKTCKSKESQCINCGGNHSSLSMKCYIMKNEKIKRIKVKEQDYINKFTEKPNMSLEQTFDRIVEREIKRSVDKIKKEINEVASRSVSKRSQYLLFFILNIIHLWPIVVKRVAEINKKIKFFIDIQKELLKALFIQAINLRKTHEKNKE